MFPLGTLAYISRVTQGFRILKSDDMGGMALATLRDVIRRRVRGAVKVSTVEEYLNGEMRNGLQNESSDVSNTWSRIRSATARLRRKIECRWYIDAGYRIGVSLNGFPIETSEVERVLRNAVRKIIPAAVD